MLLPAQLAISRRVSPVQLEIHSISCLGVVEAVGAVEAVQMQDPVTQSLWINEGAVAVVERATTKVPATAIRTLMGQQLELEQL